MKASRFRKVPNRPIQGRSGHPQLCACHRRRPVLLSHVWVGYRIAQLRRNARMSVASSTFEGRTKLATRDRRYFIGGSDARIIMGSDEAALIRLWREKRGEAEPEDLSGNLIVQLGTATEELNRSWYERNTGR